MTAKIFASECLNEGMQGIFSFGCFAKLLLVNQIEQLTMVVIVEISLPKQSTTLFAQQEAKEESERFVF